MVFNNHHISTFAHHHIKKVMSKKVIKKKNIKATAKPKPKAKAAAKKPTPKKKTPTAKAKITPKPKPSVAKPKPAVAKKAAPVAKAKPLAKAKAAAPAKAKTNDKPVAKPPTAQPKVKKETAKELKIRMAEKAIADKAAQEAMIENRIHSNPLMQLKQREQYAKKPPAEHILPAEANRERYSDKELEEFRKIIVAKLDEAKKELNNLTQQMISANENGTDDTAGAFKMLEEGSENLAKEEAGQLAQRQKKFIEQLEAALMRIENKTYGICVVTGKLIPKARLRAVPHTTKSIEAKLNQYRE
jgi:RNA polymerase-binding transcription factor DksA